MKGTLKNKMAWWFQNFKSPCLYLITKITPFQNSKLLTIIFYRYPPPSLSVQEALMITCPWMQGMEKKLKETSIHSSISSQCLNKQNQLWAGCWIPASVCSKTIIARVRGNTQNQISRKWIYKESLFPVVLVSWACAKGFCNVKHSTG